MPIDMFSLNPGTRQQGGSQPDKQMFVCLSLTHLYQSHQDWAQHHVGETVLPPLPVGSLMVLSGHYMSRRYPADCGFKLISSSTDSSLL